MITHAISNGQTYAVISRIGNEYTIALYLTSNSISTMC